MDYGYEGLVAPCPECGDEHGECGHRWAATTRKVSDMRIDYRKAEYDKAADTVLRTIDELRNRLDRDAAQITLAQNGEPCIVPDPKWVTQDAVKVTEALTRFNCARAEYGRALENKEGE